MRIRRISAVVAMAAGGLLIGACGPATGNGGGVTTTTTSTTTTSTTTTTTTVVPGQATTIVYNGPRGNCDREQVLVGVRVKPCQGLANGTTSVIVSSKVFEATCVDFAGFYPITSVVGTAKQGSAPAVALTPALTTPGSPTFETGFNIDNGPITVTITNLVVNTSGGIVCGWFGIRAD